MKVTLMLTDFAQVINGKFYIMGGGWTVIGPQPTPSALAIKIEVPWNETNRKHNWKVELMDADGHPVMMPDQNGKPVPIMLSGPFEAGRPAGVLPGTPTDIPLALNIGPLPLAAGCRFVWKFYINGESQPDWQVTFSTRTQN